MKVYVNYNLTSIFNYIHDSNEYISWYELVSWCLDMQYYKELYLNHFIIKYLLDEHNSYIESLVDVPTDLDI